MAKIELTLEQARKQSASFMYVFADDKYLSYIKPEYATIIRGKRANQKKLLLLSAQEFINKNATLNGSEYNQYVDAVKSGFVADYGMTPTEALVKLAMGEQVAGKYWDTGVFGVGATRNTNTFAGMQINDTPVTVDPVSGHIFVGINDITDETKTVYATIGKKTVAYQFFSKDQGFGTIFVSQYNKILKKYYAQTYTDDEGKMHSAVSGNITDASDGADIWGNIELSLPTFQKFIEWILSLFGINTAQDAETERINTGNTLPNQKTDGYATQAGLGEMGGILLALAAGGALLAGGVGNKKTAK